MAAPIPAADPSVVLPSPIPYANADIPPDATRLRDLSPQQWKSGAAAWLGWLFDGLDIHLYTLVAGTFVAALLAAPPGSAAVNEKSAFIQAGFLVGWAVGGAVFGRLGDLLGRSRALSLTILTYALFTGLSFFVTNWQQLMGCRFLAALGIGGEWAVGSALLAETWPAKWRAWLAAVLQTGVNVGILIACVAFYVMADARTVGLLRHVIPTLPADYYLRAVFLIGIVPAGMVFWIRRHVPEPEAWALAKAAEDGRVAAGGSRVAPPGLADLFRGPVRRTTLLTAAVCATSLTGWWAFLFWYVQHLTRLPSVAGWSAADKDQLKTAVFFLVIGVSVGGNFFAAWVARRVGYRNAIAGLFVLFAAAIVGAYCVPRTHRELIPWLAAVGFCSGVFGLFTMYLPPLFPTLLRTTGAGFAFNVGRLVAAAGTVVFALGLAKVEFRTALLCDGLLFLPAAAMMLLMPDLRDPTTARR
ncbi:MAG: nanT 1 [Phycisphaerales bacterium]|nr:nanT 1 [Phycisphaerales bacterium]